VIDVREHIFEVISCLGGENTVKLNKLFCFALSILYSMWYWNFTLSCVTNLLAM